MQWRTWLGASVAIRNRVERLSGEERPELLRPGGGVDVYRVDEPVLDTRTYAGFLEELDAILNPTALA